MIKSRPSVAVLAISLAAFALAACTQTSGPNAPQVQLSQNAQSHAAFDPEQVPFVSRETKNELARNMDRWRSRRQSAIAVSEGGRWEWATTNNDRVSQADIERRALERCQHIQQEPCHLFWSNGRVVYTPGATPSAQQIRYGGRFDPMAVPFVGDHWRRQGLQTNDTPYLRHGRNKAIAISPGGHYWIEHGDGRNAEQVSRDAVRGCESSAEMTCVLYAVNEEIVFTAGTPIR